jgi:hypothetical protein
MRYVAMSEPQYWNAVRRFRNVLLEGRVVAIDPSCGSNSSMPGYAIYNAGILIGSGVIQIPLARELHTKLQWLANYLRTDPKFQGIELLLIEAIPVTRHGRGANQLSHSSLIKAVGAIISSINCPYIMYVPIQTWKAYANTVESYSKGDEADARMIGASIIQLATTIPGDGGVNYYSSMEMSSSDDDSRATGNRSNRRKSKNTKRSKRRR